MSSTKDAVFTLEDSRLLEAFYRTRTPSLRADLISRHIPLVESIAKHFLYHAHGEPLEDLIQVGTIGLIKAVDRFDPSKKTQFNTYATHQISGELRHYLRDKVDTIKHPRWLRFLAYQIYTEAEALTQKLGRYPTAKELADNLNIREDGILEILKLQEDLSPASLDAEGKLRTLEQKIRAQRLVSFQLPIEDKVVLMKSFEKLLAIERKAIYLFFYYDLTQSEIGSQLGLSQRAVSRVIQKGLGKLKDVLTSELW